MQYRELSAPVSVQLEITEKCNNNCIHCYNYWREEKRGGFKTLSADKLSFIADQLIKNKIFSVTLTGGEPLLAWHILPALISKLTASGISVGMNSNLTLLTPEIAKLLVISGLKSILVSVLSYKEEVHDKISNHKGAFRKTIEGIRVAMSNGLKVGANMVLLQQNFNDIYNTAKFLKQFRIRSFSATKASPSLNSRNFNEMRLTSEQLKKSLIVLNKIKKELGMVVNILECYPLCLIGDIVEFNNFARRSCTAGVTTCTINPIGDIRPCSHADMVYGNIFQEDFFIIWKKMDDWKLGKYIPKECNKCKFVRLCSGGCRMEAKYLGNICGKDPYMSVSEDVVQHLYQKSDDNFALDLNKKYALHNGFQLRQETFGAIVKTDKSGIFLVNSDGVKALKIINQHASFTIKELLEKIDIKAEGLINFIGLLIKRNAIYVVKNHKRR